MKLYTYIDQNNYKIWQNIHILFLFLAPKNVISQKFINDGVCTECPKIYHKSVLSLHKYKFAVYLSRFCTDLR